MYAVLPGRFMPLHLGHVELFDRAIRYCRGSRTAGDLDIVVVGTPEDRPTLSTRVRWVQNVLGSLASGHRVAVRSLEIPVQLGDPKKEVVAATLRTLRRFLIDRNYTDLIGGDRITSCGVEASLFYQELGFLPAKRICTELVFHSGGMRTNWLTTPTNACPAPVFEDLSEEFAVHTFDSLQLFLGKLPAKWGNDRTYPNVSTFTVPNGYFWLTPQCDDGMRVSVEKFASELARMKHNNRHLHAANIINYSPRAALLACNPEAPRWALDVFEALSVHPRTFHVLVAPLASFNMGTSRRAFLQVYHDLRSSGAAYEVVLGNSGDEVRKVLYSYMNLRVLPKFVSALPTGPT